MPSANLQERDTPALLERRPEARAFRIEDLLAEVGKGRVRIPSFQRAFRWKRDDALQLFDSIYRGYPVGTLLFWQTAADAAEMKFGSVAVHAGARSDALWVVDGQQRLTSLVRVLLASGEDADEFALHFDLDEGEFAAPSSGKRDADASRWLPMTEVLDSERLIQWLLREAGANRERRDRAIQLGRRIREYDVPAYLVHTDSEQTVREVFRRSNSHGKRMKVDEVFDALHGMRTQDSPATIAQIVDEVKALEFGVVDRKIIHRLLSVLQDTDIAQRAREGIYRRTAQVARSVVQFVEHDVRIPHYDLLPYKQPLVTLGKFFQHHPTPRPRSRELLVRWLWRGALNGSHRGDVVSTRRALGLIKADGEEASVQGLLSIVGARPEHGPDAMEPFNFRHAASKLQALAMMSLGPRDLATGAPLELAPQEAPFQTIVSSSSADATRLWRSAANRLAYPACPGLRRLLTSVDDEAVLASHGIPRPAIEALRAGDAQRFMTLRAERLSCHFNAFFERHARWDESNRPSLASLIVGDEDA